jgi:hypothetical protein
MNLIKKLLIAAGCIIMINGCKKDDLEPDNYLIYKIDGILKTAVPEGTNFSDGSLMVDAKSDDGDDVTLFIDANEARPGAFYPAMLFSDTGLLIIKSYDGSNISGTFHFEVQDGQSIKKITEGQFHAKISLFGVSTEEPCYEDSTCDVAGKKKLMQQKIRPSSIIR